MAKICTVSLRERQFDKWHLLCFCRKFETCFSTKMDIFGSIWAQMPNFAVFFGPNGSNSAPLPPVTNGTTFFFVGNLKPDCPLKWIFLARFGLKCLILQFFWAQMGQTLHRCPLSQMAPPLFLVGNFKPDCPPQWIFLAPFWPKCLILQFFWPEWAKPCTVSDSPTRGHGNSVRLQCFAWVYETELVVRPLLLCRAIRDFCTESICCLFYLPRCTNRVHSSSVDFHRFPERLHALSLGFSQDFVGNPGIFCRFLSGLPFLRNFHIVYYKSTHIRTSILQGGGLRVGISINF